MQNNINNLQNDYKINKFKINNNYQDIITTFLNINKNSNYYCFPTMLYVKIEPEFDINKIIKCLSYNNLSFYYSNDKNLIFSICVGFFINLYGYTIENDYILIPLNFKMFLENVIFPKLKPLYINIENSGLNIFLDVEIVYTNENISESVFIQYVHKQEYKNFNKNHKLNIIINSNNLGKGFFIQTNIDLIKNIKLSLNNVERLNYDEILLNTVCEKINNNIFYIPLNINEKYETCNSKSFSSSINFSRIDETTFEIDFKEPTNKIVIYSLNCNFMRNLEDLLGLAFSLN